MTMALVSSSAFAAGVDEIQNIYIRANDKENYSRLVFDWGTSLKDSKSEKNIIPHYSTKKNLNSLVVTFSDKVKLMQEGASPKDLSRITDYKVISPNQIEINFDKDIDVRHFVSNNRLIVDMKGQAKKQDVSAKDNFEVSKKIAVNIEAAAGEVKASPSVIIDEISPEKEKVETVKSEKKITITLTSTSSIPLAAFENNGYLWVILGKDNVKIPPQITGYNNRFENIPAQTGLSVFRLKLDNQLFKSASGGGLAWKIDVSDKEIEKLSPIKYEKLAKQKDNKVELSLLWPAASVRRITEFKDPETGDKILLALVESAKDFTGKKQNFVDFKSLESHIGLAIIPKIDDLKLSSDDGAALLTNQKGLNIASDQDITTAKEAILDKDDMVPNNSNIKSIYDFKNWQIGSKTELSDNQRLIMSGLSPQTDTKKAESLINLAKLVLSFNYAPEAIGYLELAKSFVPEIDTNPEFMAIMAAAEALSWQPKAAFAKFSDASLNDIDELVYWRSYTLAKLDDWQQASKILPNNFEILDSYTDDIKVPFSLKLLEVALREGNPSKAKNIIEILEPLRPNMTLPYASSYDYLLGEYNRQIGKSKEATTLWKDLSDGSDDLYRARSRFAATMMQLDAKEITEDKAVDILEGLRYAWRGDDLEVSINTNLAKIYFKKNEPVKALTMMELARSLNPTSELGKKVEDDMRTIFKELFSDKKIKDISPVDILILYNDFSKLIPPGAEGENLTRQLAERMATADLLPRAIAILKKQADGGLKGLDGVNVAIRLATLQNLDSKPDDALKSLDLADVLLKDLPIEDVLVKQNDIGLLRAKAYSLKGNVEDAFSALSLLPQDEDTLHLRADIAWRGKKWQEAADSLEQILQNRNLDLTQPLDENNAELILNWAVALYLADNRYVLANVRERYSDPMLATTRAKKFDVVTRPRQGSLLSDRETINSIIDETIIFKDFLTSFKTAETGSQTKLVAPQHNGNVLNPKPTNIPDELKNAPNLKTDEVLAD